MRGLLLVMVGGLIGAQPRVAVVAVGDSAAAVAAAVENGVRRDCALVPKSEVDAALSESGLHCSRSDAECWHKVAIVAGFDVVLVAAAAGGIDPDRPLALLRVDADGSSSSRVGRVADASAVAERALHNVPEPAVTSSPAVTS